MFTTAPQSPRQPQAGRVAVGALTSSVKRSVLAMSMRFSYDARIRIMAAAFRSITKSWNRTCRSHSFTHSFQEFWHTRISPINA